MSKQDLLEEVLNCVCSCTPFKLIVHDIGHQGIYIPDYDESQYQPGDYTLVETKWGPRFALVINVHPCLSGNPDWLIEIVLTKNEYWPPSESTEVLVDEVDILCLMTLQQNKH